MNTSPASTNARDDADPWFMTKVVVAAVTINYIFGPAAVVLSCVGWLWGVRNHNEYERI